MSQRQSPMANKGNATVLMPVSPEVVAAVEARVASLTSKLNALKSLWNPQAHNETQQEKEEELRRLQREYEQDRRAIQPAQGSFDELSPRNQSRRSSRPASASSQHSQHRMQVETQQSHIQAASPIYESSRVVIANNEQMERKVEMEDEEKAQLKFQVRTAQEQLSDRVDDLQREQRAHQEEMTAVQLELQRVNAESEHWKKEYSNAQKAASLSNATSSDLKTLKQEMQGAISVHDSELVQLRSERDGWEEEKAQIEAEHEEQMELREREVEELRQKVEEMEQLMSADDRIHRDVTMENGDSGTAEPVAEEPNNEDGKERSAAQPPFTSPLNLLKSLQGRRKPSESTSSLNTSRVIGVVDVSSDAAQQWKQKFTELQEKYEIHMRRKQEELERVTVENGKLKLQLDEMRRDAVNMMPRHEYDAARGQFEMAWKAKINELHDMETKLNEMHSTVEGSLARAQDLEDQLEEQRDLTQTARADAELRSRGFEDKIKKLEEELKQLTGERDELQARAGKWKEWEESAMPSMKEIAEFMRTYKERKTTRHTRKHASRRSRSASASSRSTSSSTSSRDSPHRGRHRNEESGEGDWREDERSSDSGSERKHRSRRKHRHRHRSRTHQHHRGSDSKGLRTSLNRSLMNASMGSYLSRDVLPELEEVESIVASMNEYVPAEQVYDTARRSSLGPTATSSHSHTPVVKVQLHPDSPPLSPPLRLSTLHHSARSTANSGDLQHVMGGFIRAVDQVKQSMRLVDTAEERSRQMTAKKQTLGGSHSWQRS